MKMLKSIFHTLYFSYLLISMLLFVFQDGLQHQTNPEFLSRFLNFWVILGFVFFISIWVIQAIHVGILNKDMVELEGKVIELKSKLYDLNRSSQVQEKSKKTGTPMDDPETHVSKK